MKYLYAIMTSHGFQMRGSEAAVYTSVDEALKHKGPNDELVPIEDEPQGNFRNPQILRHHAISISEHRKQMLGLRQKS